MHLAQQHQGVVARAVVLEHRGRPAGERERSGGAGAPAAGARRAGAGRPATGRRARSARPRRRRARACPRASRRRRPRDAPRGRSARRPRRARRAAPAAAWRRCAACRATRDRPCSAEDGAPGVDDDRVHAVARLDDAPAHLLDDACLHAPRTISACPSYPSSRRSSKRSIPWSRARRCVMCRSRTSPWSRPRPRRSTGSRATALTGAVRRGKHLLFPTDEDLVLTVHLMTAGKLAYVEPGAKRPPGPVLVVRFADDGELVVSERVTRKSVRVRLLPAAELDGGVRAARPRAARALVRRGRARGGARARRATAHAAARPARARRHRPRLRQRDPARGAPRALRERRPALAGGARAPAGGDQDAR